MRHVIVLFALSIAACGVDQPEPMGMGSGSGSDHGSPADGFVGAYRTTITISGTSSQTYTDSMSISPGTTSDLILQSQQLGAIKAKIIGATAFSIDQQQITLTDANGNAFSVTMQGQGTVTGGVFNAAGQLSSNTGALAFTIAGSRL
jgi:hypothetical protein